MEDPVRCPSQSQGQGLGQSLGLLISGAELFHTVGQAFSHFSSSGEFP